MNCPRYVFTHSLVGTLPFEICLLDNVQRELIVGISGSKESIYSQKNFFFLIESGSRMKIRGLCF